MSLSSRSIVAATWEFGSVISQAVIQLGVMAILARLISPEGFGLYAIVTTSLGMIALISEIGVGQAVVQRKDLTDPFIYASFLISLALGLLGTVATWIASPAIAGFFKRPEVTDMIRVASIMLVINGFVTVATGLLERELLFKKLAVINVTSYIIGFGCVGGVLAFMKVGAWAIVAATVSQTLVRALLLIKMVKVKVARVYSKSEMKEILRFCAGVSLGRIFNNLASQVDYLVVGRMMGPKPLGLYQMGYQIMDLPRRFLAGVIDRVMFSVFTRIQDDDSRLRFAYTQSLELTNTILIPLTALMIVVTPEAIRVALGDQWGDLVVPLQIILLQVPLRASVRMGDVSGTAVGRVYGIGFLKMIYAAMIGVAAIVGVRWGLKGVTIAVSVAVLINLILIVRFTRSFVKISVREYLRIWVPGAMVGSLVVAASLPGMWIARSLVESSFLRLLIVLPFTLLLLLLALWIRPRLIGRTALQLVLDFGKRIPFVSPAALALERRSSERNRP